MSQIRASERSKYPTNWRILRETILRRSGGACEWCRKMNHSRVCVAPDGSWYYEPDSDADNHDTMWVFRPGILPEQRHARNLVRVGQLPQAVRTIRVVLTIAHLDHDPTHNHPDNLRALCQKCHNRYDAWMRAAGRRERKIKEAEDADV